MRKILRGHVFNINFLFTLCLGFAFSATHAQVSGTFTINRLLPASSTNFQTFSAAAASLAGGVNGPVTFNVQPGSGPYNEQMVLNNISGTSATNTITFNCNGVTLTFLSTNTNSRAGIKLNNTDYVTIDNLRIEPQALNLGEYGCGFHLLNDADNNTIKNCHIVNNPVFDHPEGSSGIVINGNDQKPTDLGNSDCDNNLIQQNIIEGCGIAISLASMSTGTPVLINGNKLIRNSISNFLVSGIELYNTSNTQVDGNDITGGYYTFTNAGINMQNSNQKVAVINNRIHEMICDPSYIGTSIYGIINNSKSVAGQENLIANNAIYNWSSGSGSIQYGISSDGGTFFNIYHNTISLDDQTQTGEKTRGVSLENNVSDINFMNNIISVTRLVSIENYGFYIDATIPRFASDHNVFYVTTTAPAKAYLGHYNNNFADNLTIWRTNSGQDLFSFALNPLYANAAAGDLSPTVQTIDNMGLNVNISTDINANTRNNKFPDPGCFEFTSAACGTSIVGGSPMITPDSAICQGPKVTMGLIGNSAGGGQTYTWQTATAQTGPFTNATSALDYPYLEVTPTSTLFYRVAITCGTSTSYSSIMKVLVTSPLNGGTYTINDALPTGGVNFNSFSDAAKALQCGLNGSIVFNVVSGSGPYQEQMVIPAINTAPNKTVTFNGNGATIALATTNTKTTVIKLDGADYITIDSLNIAVQGTASGIGFGVVLMNNADNNTIKRCIVNVNKTSFSTKYGGIIISAKDNDPANSVDSNNCDYNLITNNKVIGGYYGITSASQTFSPQRTTSIGNIIRSNKITDNCGIGIFIGGNGNLLVDSNDISHPTRTAFPPIVPFQAITVNGLNTGLNITKNRIHNLFDSAQTINNQLTGIAFISVPGTATEPNVVSNNLLYNYKGVGLQEGLYTFNSKYLKFYHNSVSLEDTGAYAINETRGFGMFGGDSVGVEFKNNNIVIRRGGEKKKYCIYLDKADSNLVANYNNYYMRSPLGGDTLGSMGGLFYPTLNNWLFTRKDSSSINIDPVYNDLAKGDLTPTKILFENRGLNVGITTDQLNNTRNTTKPDIGAIEFTICSPLTTPVLDVLDSSTNFIKFGWTAVPNTTGYRVSRDNLNWTIPSSGALGTTHTVTGLKPTDKINLWVKALGTRADCPEYVSNQREGTATTDGIFVPNTFTPNNDQKNDKFKVYSAVTRSVHWMVFNQWGEKVFESNEIMGDGWDGTYKGKPQPIGVYVYVVSGVLLDGTKVTKKGSFNLVR